MGTRVTCKAPPRSCDSRFLTTGNGTWIFQQGQRSHRGEFLLVVSPTAKVDAGLEAHLAAHGGRVIRKAASDHSIYVGAEDPVGWEIDGWVACAGSVWSEVLGQATSGWLRDNLVVGREFEGEDLRRLRTECLRSPLKGTNIDEEPLAEAMINLIDAAESAAGCVFVQ